MKKSKIIYIILPVLLYILLPIVSAIDECRGTMNDNEIPCAVLLPVTIGDNCSAISVTFYRNGSNILDTKMMDEYTPFSCNTTFNYSSFGTYIFNYSTEDSGSIIIEEDVDNRYYLYVISLVIFIVLLIAGYYSEQFIFTSIAGMLIVVTSIYLFRFGFPNLTNEFLRNGICIVLWGLGAYFILAPFAKFFEEWRDSE